ncbi:MAG TPA: hypothetical protein VHN81_02315, partial [Edaphobacter sp.]|nr:hypothetical protein [Edaphobacter sp.]
TYSKFVATGTLSKEGTMKAKMEFTERGDDELLMRALLRQLPRGQWNELMQRLSQGLGFGGTTSDPDASSPEKTSEPLRLSYDYLREKTGDWENHRIVALFPIIFLPSVDEKNPPQKQPIRLGEPRIDESVSTITLPEGWGTIPPAAVHEKTAFASFDKTYKIEGEKLIADRKLQIFQREVPASEWKNYKKWLDATISEGEPYISLVSPESKAEAAAPGKDPATKPDLNALVRQGFEQLQRGEMNAAEATLKQAQEADPNSPWPYRGLIQVQGMRGQIDEAAKTAQLLAQKSFATQDDRKTAIRLLMFRHRFAEVLPLLEKQAATDPDNTAIQIQLGEAQMRTGEKESGQSTLVAALSRTVDPSILNEGADELAGAGVALDMAEKSARKAIDLLTTESSSWVMTDIPQEQKQRQILLVSTWDTLGWALVRQGKLDEAESWLEAAWLNEPDPTIGLHLGQLQERLGHTRNALETYQMSLTEFVSPARPKEDTEPERRKLQARIAALKNERKLTTDDTRMKLQHLRMFPLGSWKGPNLLKEVTISLREGKIEKVSGSADSAQVDQEERAKLMKLELTEWTPKGSAARIIKQGTLNCHGQVCELVIHPN